MTDEEKLNRRARRAAEKGARPEGAESKDRNLRLREKARAGAPVDGAGTAEVVDAAIARGADATSRFVRAQFPWLQWVLIAVFVSVIGLLVYSFRSNKQREKSGDLVSQVLDVSLGRIATAEPIQPSDRNLVDTRPEFASIEERTNRSLEAWQDLAGSDNRELRILSQLARAATLSDAKKWGEARALYDEILAKNADISSELRARAQEGIGLSLEAEGKFADARTAYEKLKHFDLPEIKNLSRFHLARVQLLQGEKEEAKTALTQLSSELGKSDLLAPRTYLALAVEDLLKTIDPQAAAETGGISPEQLEQLKRQLEAMQQQGNFPAEPPVPSNPVEDGQTP